MDRIFLRNANVVKEAASEEAALALEKKGFVRDGAARPSRAGDPETLQKRLEEQDGQLAKAREAVKAAEDEVQKYKKKLAGAETKLEEASRHAKDADKKVEALTQELAGTREQLEAAVKKNTEAEKK